MAPFIVIGIVSGAIYSLAGVGLVITFRTSGVFNFAHGAIATFAAYSLYLLWTSAHLPVGLAIAVTLLGVALIAGFAFEKIGRSVSRAGLAWQVAATAGVLIAIEALYTILYGSSITTFGQFLPTKEYEIGGVFIGLNQLIIVAVSLLGCVVLQLMLRTTRTGKSMQALVDNPDLLSISGVSARKVRTMAWITGCLFAAISGVLLSPGLGLNAPDALTLLVVEAFGAAAIGRFRSLPWTWVGGIVIGVVASIATEYAGSNPILQGLPASVPFVVLFLVLLFSRRRRGAIEAVHARIQSRSRTPTWLRLGSLATTLVVLALVPHFSGVYVTGWTIGLTYVLLFLSAGLLVRTSGQVSLCLVGFAAIGAVAFSHLKSAGLPWLPALLLGAAVVVPVGAVVAIPAIRSSGLYLAIATFGFGLVLQGMFYNSSVMFGSTGVGIPMPAPVLRAIGITPSSESFYYVVLTFVILTAAAVALLTGSRLGRLLSGLSDSPIALASLGTGTAVLRVVVFSLSAYIAGLSGALYGIVLVAPTGASFDPFMSLTILVLVLITLGGVPWYALIAGLGLGLPPAYLSGNTSEYLEILFGVFAVSAAILSQKAVPAWVLTLGDRLKVWLRLGRAMPGGHQADGASVVSGKQGGDRLPVSRRGTGIESRRGKVEAGKIVVEFGGVVAVSDVSVVAGPGQITGLIGPNGAGKTTLLNVCSGLLKPSAGRVLIGEVNVTRSGVASRARRGLGRTFQQVQLFESLTVWQNVQLGFECGVAGSNPWKQVVGRRSEARATEAKVAEALAVCGVAELASRSASTLSTGQRRLVELARCVAGGFSMLLLDEPSSGLDAAETSELGSILRYLAASGTGIVLVEHDMSIVMSVCDTLYVLDFGRLVFSGSPEAARESPVVRAAYLGTGPELDPVAQGAGLIGPVGDAP